MLREGGTIPVPDLGTNAKDLAMQTFLPCLGILALLCVAWGEDANTEATLRGELACAHCDLKKTATHEVVLVVKEGDKQELYYFPADFNRQHAQDYCKERRDAIVTGTVTETAGRKVLTIKKIVIERKE